MPGRYDEILCFVENDRGTKEGSASGFAEQDRYKALHDKYRKRYQMDKLLNELAAREFITGHF